MSELEGRLNFNAIDDLLEELSHNNFGMPEGVYVSADLANRITETLGCEDARALDIDREKRIPGSDLIRILMYQNLLLAKRVSELEQRYDN